jgi:transcriptional regulator with XRE-family HTH domain
MLRSKLQEVLPFVRKSEAPRTRTCNRLIKSQLDTLKLLHKLTVSELAELINLSKAYISQVKHGKRPPSQKLLGALSGLDKPNSDVKDYLFRELEQFP